MKTKQKKKQAEQSKLKIIRLKTYVQIKNFW